MPTEPSVGERVKVLRAERGLSQAALARLAKMDRAHLKRIEDGDYRHPRPENLAKLARALNVEIEELTGRESLRQIAEDLTRDELASVGVSVFEPIDFRSAQRPEP